MMRMFSLSTLMLLIATAAYGDDRSVNVLPIDGTPVVPLHQQIDELIAERSEGVTAKRTSDAEFLRRVTLDFAGRVPTVNELKLFLDERMSDKRTRKISELIDSPLFARRLRDILHVMLMERMGDNADWSAFLQASAAANRPWNQIVADILNPNADDESNRAAAFFWTKRLEKSGQNPTDYPGLARDIGRLFLGMDLQCAQCHDHLFVDDYSQHDFQGLFAFVGHTKIRTDVKFPAVAEGLVTSKVEFSSVFTQKQQATAPRLPDADEVMIPALAKEEQYVSPPDRKTRFPGVPRFSPLRELATQLPNADNRDFCRNSVNRFWFVMFGRGLVDPLDLNHSGNPASHPELLDLLADEFAKHNFDIRWLLQELAETETWQRSSQLADATEFPPEETYAVALERPLSAEQLLRSLLTVTQQDQLLSRLDSSEKNAELTELENRFRSVFANPPRDPEIDFRPGVKSALYLMNDQSLQKWFAADSPVVQRLSTINDEELPAEIYLGVLSRPPTDDEENQLREALRVNAPLRAASIGHVLWALAASAEFCLNH